MFSTVLVINSQPQGYDLHFSRHWAIQRLVLLQILHIPRYNFPIPNHFEFQVVLISSFHYLLKLASVNFLSVQYRTTGNKKNKKCI